MKQKIVYFGSGWYTIPVVKKLLPLGLDLVITTENNPDSPFLKFCNENNLKTITARSSKELTNNESQITNHQIAVLASYGALVPDEIISLFPHGIINIHPSLLPKWKGPSPIQFALLNGDTITGVTLIKLDRELDHGPILSQKPYTLQGNETTEDLLSILFEIGAEMVEDIIAKLENGEEISETPQNHEEETWSYHIEKKDGMIDIQNLRRYEIASPLEGQPTTRRAEPLGGAYNLQNMIRAYFPWPGVWLRYPVIASESKQSKLSNKLIKLLPENKIQVEGKNAMSYQDFINGFGEEGKELLQKLGVFE